MLLEEMLKKSKKEGYAEGEAKGYAKGETRGLKQSLQLIISNYDKPIPSHIEQIIDEANDADSVNVLIKKALQAKTLEEFIAHVTVS